MSVHLTIHIDGGVCVSVSARACVRAFALVDRIRRALDGLLSNRG